MTYPRRDLVSENKSGSCSTTCVPLESTADQDWCRSGFYRARLRVAEKQFRSPYDSSSIACFACGSGNL